MKRGAFLEQYKQQPLFKENLEEFDSSKEVVQQLIDEYNSATKPDYFTYSTSQVKIYIFILKIFKF